MILAEEMLQLLCFNKIQIININMREILTYLAIIYPITILITDIAKRDSDKIIERKIINIE